LFFRLVAGVVAIDWMVQHSTWAPTAKSFKRDWCNEVVMQWFEPGNTAASDIFLERAETFLCRRYGEGNTTWGMKILEKVVLTK